MNFFRGDNMQALKIGDIVSRKSYSGDICFKITDVEKKNRQKPVFTLKGIMHRIEADSSEDDLVKEDSSRIDKETDRYIITARKNMFREMLFYHRSLYRGYRSKPGKILHIDSSRELLDMCVKHYRESNLKYVTHVASEREQPYLVRGLLEENKPDILVVTGHDGIKKDTADLYSLDNYRNSRYYVQSVKEARKYESSKDKLCVFAGACQSYYEAIMDQGANFASSPGRILINGLDPGIVAEKVAITDYRRVVTPSKIAEITISGRKGIGGIDTRGHLK